MKRNNYGRDWELQICRYIELKGMKILARNFTVKGGEADIIAKDAGYVCFIEIKFRNSGSIDAGRSVGTKKQLRIIKSAEKYLRETDCQLQPRFDVVFVTATDDGVSLEYIENAFDGSGV
jgi:putative endonuclease